MADGHRLGLIVGSGFADAELPITGEQSVATPYGPPSSPLFRVGLGGREIVALARHGFGHEYAPHEVNYRANIRALRDAGVDRCIGLNIVGGIAEALGPAELAVPDQLIDYTWGRAGSFGGDGGGVVHVEFAEPFSATLRSALVAAVESLGLTAHAGTYAVSQGPRLETRAEIDRFERDGCAMVGMTAMPEAALAREAGIDYALLAGVVNYAAGRGPAGVSVHAQMHETVGLVMARSRQVIEALVSRAASGDL